MQPQRIVEPPQACMTGGRGIGYFELDDAYRHYGGVIDGFAAGGPLDAPDFLPVGGAWNFAVRDTQLSYGSVLRPGYLA